MRKIFCLIFFYVQLLQAQEPSYYNVGKDIFDGVELYSCIQDTNNSVWITSNKGLYNYNGIEFKKIAPPSPKASILFGLIKDSKHNIFAHNLSGQIYQIKNDSIKLYYDIPKKYLGGYFKMQFDEMDNLLIGTKGLIKINHDKKLTFTKNKGYLLTKQQDTIYHITIDHGNVKILQRYNNKDKIVENYQYNKALNFGWRLFKINNKFYGYDYNYKKVTRCFTKLENSSVVPVKLPFINHTNFIPFKTKNSLWFSDIRKGVYKIDNKNLEQKNNPKKWFKEYYISSVMIDNEKNTWLLTFNKGIIIIPNVGIKTTNYNFKSEISGISKTKNNIFFGSLDGNIYQLKNKKAKLYFKTQKDRLKHFSIYPDKNLIVTNEKFYTSKTPRFTSFNRDEFVIGDTLYCAIYKGITAYNLHTKKEREITNNRVFQMCYDSINKQIWNITIDGLFRYQNGKQKPVLYKKKHINSNNILSVNNKFWATTKSGIYILKDNQIIDSITEKDGLLHPYTQSIKYEKPYVYLSSEKGMQRYNTFSKRFQTIHKADGLISKILQFEVLKDTVYALTSNNLLLFTFNNTTSRIPRYKTLINNIVCNGNKKIHDNIVLNADENNIEFSFLTPTFKYQKNVTYQYQLKGLEKKEIKAKDQQHHVNYSNLPPGKYTFIVNSFINNQKNETAYFNFTIKKKWFHKFWFRLLIFFLCLIVVLSISKYRTDILKTRKNEEQMLKRLAESSLISLKAQMNPHFLFNAMNSIQFLILTNKKNEAYQYLTELSNLVRENLRMSNTSFVHLEDELKLVKKYLDLEKLRFEETLNYNITVNLDDTDISIPSMIIQPFIENAIKHGLLHKKNNRLINIDFFKENDFIKCIIVDNGIGRTASTKMYQKREHKSFSTNAIKKRFSILQEYYQINISFKYEDLYENNKATGTKVTIKIPFYYEDKKSNFS